MNSQTFLKASGLLLVTSGIAWHFATRVKPAHIAVGLDSSQSVAENCDGLKAMSRSWIETLPGIAKGSTFSLLLMGESARNQEPTLMFSILVPLPPDTPIGQDVAGYEARKQELLGRIDTACRSAASGQSSPVYQMLKQSLAHLRSEDLGCGADRACYLLIKTDLDDDTHSELRGVIQRSAREPAIEVGPVLAASLDNEGVSVTFCGLAELQVQHGKPPSSSAEARERVWRQLFTHADRVSFQPYCR